METTLTAVFGAGRDLFFAHVGHSRAYLFRGGRLMRLTSDQVSEVGPTLPVLSAPIENVNGEHAAFREGLVNAIGMGGSDGPRIDLGRFQLLDRDVVLVCTNGLTDRVTDARIGEVLGSLDAPGTQAQLLADLAVNLGADDDVTALVARYHLPA
jgi:protein phosphatase